ncbi:MAG: hypothetical protein WCO94_10900 [Verrucomicrobiota bacterium]|jgi:hypothetical protein
MTLNESIVEDAALAMPRATLIPDFSRGEKGKREAIRRLNPANACSNPHPASPTGRGEKRSHQPTEPVDSRRHRPSGLAMMEGIS